MKCKAIKAGSHIKSRKKARRKFLAEMGPRFITRFVENKIRKNELRAKYRDQVFEN